MVEEVPNNYPNGNYTYFIIELCEKIINPVFSLRFFLLQIQFVLVMIHAFQLLFIDCDYPKAFVWWIGMHAVMFYFLFSDFYKQAYNKKQERKAKIEVS